MVVVRPMVAFFLAVTLLVVMTGCGRKAPPRPPAEASRLSSLQIG